ncbi:MAG: DASS family sodium-coupled anion symporter [Candidatus Electryonea clarkiae]|nr:DASS family sodium-coupled anion symporter [Candidatus Electryonea clarkiae]MDP8287827.1 DASS family sodium-coupled anion symporter [Candidatus Electryonea clarkiae]
MSEKPSKLHKPKDKEEQGTGFARRTDFKWLGLGVVVFILLAVVMPLPESMLTKAQELFVKLSPEAQAETSPETIAYNIKIIIALLGMCVVFFATEAIPLPAVALIIGLVQLFFGTTPPLRIVASYAHDAVWFIAGSLALGATLIKYGLDKRIGMLVMRFSGTNIRRIIIGLLLGTSIPAAFIGEHAVAGMYLPIALALYTLTNKEQSCPNLGRLLAITVAFGCMIGGPMSPTGGARNAIMIGFLTDFGVEVTFLKWLSMGVAYTLIMVVVMSIILPILFKPEVKDLSYAVSILSKDLEKHGKMTGKQWLVTAIMALVVFLWITDKSLVKGVLGFSLGLGGIAILGTVIYMLLGLTTWKDYEGGVSWGVVILYAGAISLGAAFKSTGAASWLAEGIMSAVEPLGISSGLPLIILVVLVGASLTNLMSAGATVAVIGPVILGMAESSGTNPLLVGIALAISTSAAFWLVIGTPASSIVYSSGLLTAKDFIRGGSLAWPLAVLAILGMIVIYWIPVLGIKVGM